MHASQPQWRVVEPGSKVLIPRERIKSSFLVHLGYKGSVYIYTNMACLVPSRPLTHHKQAIETKTVALSLASRMHEALSLSSIAPERAADSPHIPLNYLSHVPNGLTIGKSQVFPSMNSIPALN